MKTKLLALTLLAISIASCTRPENKAMVVIKFPEKINLGSTNASPKVSAQGNSDWGVSTPGNINGFNCFALFIASPKLGSDKSCVIGEGANFKKIPWGKIYGLYSSSATVDLGEFDSGSMTFNVLGFKSADGQCASVNDIEQLPQSNLSEPLLLGSVTKDLAPGVNSIEINVSLAADPNSQRVRDCSNSGSSSPAKMEANGPVNFYNYNSMLGYGTCNRVPIRLRSIEGKDGFFESNAVVSATATIASVHLQPDCTDAAISTLTFSPGESTKVFYISAPPSASSGSTGTFTLTGPAGSGLTASAMLSFGSASTLSSIEFYEETARSIAGVCSEAQFYARDSFGYTTLMSGGHTPQVFDMSNTPQSTSGTIMSDFRFKTSCASGAPDVSGTLNLTGSSSSLYFMTTNSYSDYKVGFFVGDRNVSVNVVPKAFQLKATPSSSTIYASDCVNVEYKGYDNSGSPIASYPASDFGPFGSQTRINFSSYVSGSGFPPQLRYSGCTTPVGNNPLFLSTASPSQTYSFRPLAAGTFAIETRAYPFLVDREFKDLSSVISKWDPSVYGNFGASVSYFVPTVGGPTIQSKYFSGSMSVASFAASSMGSIANDLGPGKNVYNFNSGGSFIGGSVPSFGQFSYSLMVHGTLGVLNNYYAVTRDNSPGYEYAAVQVDSSDTGQVKLVYRSAGNPAETATFPLPLNQWSTITVTRNASNCTLYINGLAKVSPACDSNIVEYFSVGKTSTSVPGKYGEFTLVDYALSATEVRDHHNYLKDRYPSASLPVAP